MTDFIKRYQLTVIGTVIGTAGGYAYYYFIGCSSGGCAITSNPINSTIYGSVMGGLLFNMIQSEFLNKSKNGK